MNEYVFAFQECIPCSVCVLGSDFCHFQTAVCVLRRWTQITATLELPCSLNHSQIKPSELPLGERLAGGEGSSTI